MSICVVSLKHGRFNREGYTSVMIVPTGIGAAIGGYAGDALPSARLLSSCVDTLITHPNVLNGAMLYWPIENALYVEGYALDEFAHGSIGLSPMTKKGHKIGLLLDKRMEEDLITRHMQVVDAVRATLGINVAECVVSKEVFGVEIAVSSSGASWGSLRNTQTIVDGAKALAEKGCTSIAVVARFPEDEEEDGDDNNTEEAKPSSSFDAIAFDAYRQGQGVDAIAGIEALISHTIVKYVGLPCAHAPAFSPDMEPYTDTAPKAAAEELGFTFLPCVLTNLHRCPKFIPLKDRERVMGSNLGISFTSSDKDQDLLHNDQLIRARDVDSIIVPVSALGGPAVLSFLERGALVIAVEENTSSMDASASTLFDPSSESARNIVSVRSYAEAAGTVMAHKEGILLESLTSRVPKLPLQ